MVSDNDDLRPALVHFSADAKPLWVEFYNTHALEQADLTGELSAAWSKLEEYAARLALVIHLARWAADDSTLADENVVDAESINAGIRLANWFGNEARRVYAVLGESDDQRDQRRLIELIGQKGGSVTPREVKQGTRDFENVDAAKAALQQLVNAGWGRWEPTPAGQRGQPTRRFVLNSAPAVYGNTENPDENGNTVDVDNTDDPETQTPDDDWGDV